MNTSKSLDVIDQSVLLAELGELIALSDHVKKQTIDCLAQGKPLSDELLKAIAAVANIEKELTKSLDRCKTRSAEDANLEAKEVDSIKKPDQEAELQKQLAELQLRLDEKDKALEAKNEELDALKYESIKKHDQEAELQKQLAELQLRLDEKDKALEAKDKELDAALEAAKQAGLPANDGDQLSEHEEMSYQVISGLLIRLLLAKKGVSDKAPYPSEAEIIREIEDIDLYGYKKVTLAKRFKHAREKLENELKKKQPAKYRSTA